MLRLIKRLFNGFLNLDHVYKVVMILVLALLIHYLYRIYWVSPVEPFQDLGTGLSLQVDTPILGLEIDDTKDIFGKLGLKLENYKTKLAEFEQLEKKISEGTAAETEITNFSNSYQEFTQFKKGLLELLGNLDTPSKELPPIIVQIEQVYSNIFDKLNTAGFLISYDAEGNFIGIIPPEQKPSAPTAEVIAKTNVFDTEVEQFMYKQLIKRIEKLQKINQENIDYYKKLNTDQRLILLEIIKKRNREMEKLQNMVNKIENRLTPLALDQQEQLEILVNLAEETPTPPTPTPKKP